jgi:iron complex outermembrane receptor protein
VEQAVKLGHQEGDFAMVANYHHLDTNGSSEFIPQDAVGNSGTTNFWRNNHTGYARARYRNLEISALQVHKRRGTPLGITGNVDNRSDLDMTQTLGQVSYKGEVRRLKTEFRVGVNEMDWSNTWQLDIPGFGNTGNPKAKSRATDVSYRVWAPDISGHHLAAGLVFEHLQEFDVRHILDGVDVSSFLNHNQDVTRNIYALYLQDDWEINSKDTVTAGARWDHYSDFGSTINPRLAYVHSHSSDVKMKLLLARAFRAPSFIELYEINNPAGVGNPNLKAETMRTLEAGIEWRLNHWSRLSSNLFLNQFRNRITRQAPLSVNEGGADIWGFETELKADWREMRHGYLNWSWIHGEDHDTGTRLADVPHHRVKAGINWGLLKNRLNGNLGLFWAGRQLRPIGDSRPPTKAHTVIDLAVSTPSRPDGFDWALTVHNVQNKLFSDPSLPSIPGGVPRPGRTWLVEVRYKY